MTYFPNALTNIIIVFNRQMTSHSVGSRRMDLAGLDTILTLNHAPSQTPKALTWKQISQNHTITAF